MIRRLALVLLFCAAWSSRGISADLPQLNIDVAPATQVVQGQVTYMATVIRVPGIHNGYFFAPDFGEAIVVDLGRSESDDVTVAGETAEKTVHRFALFPQRSGKMEIPPATFSGPTVFVASKPVTIAVDAAPTNLADWLPASSVSVDQHWSTGPFRAGYPVVRTVTITAAGVTGAQIPPLKIARSAGYRAIRRDVTVERVTSGTEVTGRRIETLHYLPTAGGELVIPALTVNWWKDGGTAPSQARAPGRIVAVTGIVQAETAPVGAPQPTPVKRIVAPASPPDDRPLWIAVTAAIVLALAARAAWKRRHHWAASLQLRGACRRGDARAIKTALLKIGRARFPENPPRTLGELALRLGIPVSEFNAIQQGLYSPPDAARPVTVSAQRLVRAARRVPRASKAHSPAAGELAEFR